MIFLFSAEDGEESAETSEGLTLAALRVLVPDYDARPEDQQAAFQELAGHIVRKLGHFSEFALLGGLSSREARAALRPKLGQCPTR